MELSSAFVSGQTIPTRHTCDGEDRSPPLAWKGAPAATRSFVVLCDDPDAPGGGWGHWALYDLPATWHTLPEAYPATPAAGAGRHGPRTISGAAVTAAPARRAAMGRTTTISGCWRWMWRPWACRRARNSRRSRNRRAGMSWRRPNWSGYTSVAAERGFGTVYAQKRRAAPLVFPPGQVSNKAVVIALEGQCHGNRNHA